MDTRADNVALTTAAKVDFAPAQASIATHGKSFALASLWFGRQLRDEVAALYAFCRRADDAIDLAPQSNLGPTLARLFEELDCVYRGEPQSDPVLRAFQTVAISRGIPQQYAQELLLGMQMDVEHARYSDLPDLLLYCHRVAGVVGLMMCHVLGVRHGTALANAAHLGVAMQLTNISRDVLEDFERGRCYLPEQWLSEQGVPSLDGSWSDRQASAVGRVVARLLDEAERYYRSADSGMVHLPFRAALAVRTARRLYAAIGGEVRRQQYDVRKGRARVSGLRKAWLVAQALLQATAELPRRLQLALVHTTGTAGPAAIVRYEDVLPL